MSTKAERQILAADRLSRRAEKFAEARDYFRAFRCQRASLRCVALAARTVRKPQPSAPATMSDATPVKTPPMFPRNLHSEARLYPGSVRYEGIAAIFKNDVLGEVVILAPTIEALEARAKAFGYETIDRNKCHLARLNRI